MTTRRAVLGGCLAAAFGGSALAHSLYPQWVAYRRKHLLVGCHRRDERTFEWAKALVEGINHAMPAASARPARAPHPERLASLIGTDQMEVAVLARGEAAMMRDGVGRFAPYGAIPLTRLVDLGEHVLVADAGFPDRHAWMVTAAVRESGLDGPSPDDAVLPLHPGAAAQRRGEDLDRMSGGDGG